SLSHRQSLSPKRRQPRLHPHLPLPTPCATVSPAIPKEWQQPKKPCPLINFPSSRPPTKSPLVISPCTSLNPTIISVPRSPVSPRRKVQNSRIPTAKRSWWPPSRDLLISAPRPSPKLTTLTSPSPSRSLRVKTLLAPAPYSFLPTLGPTTTPPSPCTSDSTASCRPQLNQRRIDFHYAETPWPLRRDGSRISRSYGMNFLHTHKLHR